METRKSSTATILKQVRSPKNINRSVLSALLFFLFPEEATSVAPSAPHSPNLESIYFYDPTRTSLYQFIANTRGYAHDVLAQIANGLCGADANGDFPNPNMEKIRKWGAENLATLLRALNHPTQPVFEECIGDAIQERVDKQAEVVSTVALAILIFFLSIILISCLAMAACCLYDRHLSIKAETERTRNRSAALATKQLLSNMEKGDAPAYGTFRP